jgi:hypothetical protein
MEDLDMLSVSCSKNPPAGALRDRGNGGIPGGCSTGFFLFNEDTAFPYKAHHPVLRCAPRDTSCLLDISHGKKTGVLRELSHQAQVFPPVFKHACHSGC